MKKLLTTCLVLSSFLMAKAQSVVISALPAIADGSALLDVKSTTKGFLPPRMNKQQRDGITAPAAGLTVYCSDCIPEGMYIYTAGNWNNQSEKIFSIGDVAMGGIIIWLDETRKHGLAVANTDASAGIMWYNGSYTHTQAIRSGVYGGAANSSEIIRVQGNGTFATSVASAFSGGSYGDWYLPSRQELQIMYMQRALIPGLTGEYWSSTEEGMSGETPSLNAYKVNMADGGEASTGKQLPFKVRSLRKF